MEKDQQTTPMDYFTADLEQRLREMSQEEMFKSLTALEDTEFFLAILKYNQGRLSYTQSALFAGDPMKDPTGMARNQGIMLGISDLQNAVITLAGEAKKSESGTDVE